MLSSKIHNSGSNSVGPFGRARDNAFGIVRGLWLSGIIDTDSESLTKKGFSQQDWVDAVVELAFIAADNPGEA
jgi:hypothetical protein